MTENNCDLSPDLVIGNASNSSQNIEQTEVADDESATNNDFRIAPVNDQRLTTDQNIVVSSHLSHSECEERLHSLQEYWLKFSTFFRKVYHTILDGDEPPDEYECHMPIVKELVSNDPHQLFARLEMDLQEFIIEIKLRQMELLNCVHTDEGPHLFIFCLIESYNKLMFAASTLSPLLIRLEVDHLADFKISWLGLNQHLFHKLVFTEPKIQKILPFCISKVNELGKMNSELSELNKRLIRQFLNFDEEMTKIGGKWRETESAIVKYHQQNFTLDAKERMMKVNWELVKTQTKAFQEFEFSSENSSESKNGFENIQNQLICECCQTNSQFLANPLPSPNESISSIRSFDNSSPCRISCQDAEIISHLNADGVKMYSHLHKFKTHQQSVPNDLTSCRTESNNGCESKHQNLPLTSPIELHKTLMRKQQHQKKLMQMISQQDDTSKSRQPEERDILLQQRKLDELQAHLLHSANTDKEIQKKINSQLHRRLEQDEKFRDKSPSNKTVPNQKNDQEKPHNAASTKTIASRTVNSNKLTATDSARNRLRNPPLPDVVKTSSHLCLKHNDTNRCNSPDDTSDEDCSERSGSPQRHCDCCYCEAFGVTSAPVSRNFQETRERLRLILTKKKAKTNRPNDNEKPEKIVPANVTANQVDKTKKNEIEKPTQSVYKGDKSIEEILDFIEGGKNSNVKRTAKKLRRKQKQLEEEERRRKKEEEEAERLRQEELRRQEELEKKRVEEERRRQELLKEQNRKKNKKKNSKLNQQLNLLAMQQNSKKNKKKSQLQPNETNRLAQIQSTKIALQKQNQCKTKIKEDQRTDKDKHKTQEKPKPAKNNTNTKKNPQKNDNDENSTQPQMVTIKRVMQPNSNEPTVTITLRGPTPKEDKVLYTLQNGQMCQVKDENKKQTTAKNPIGNNVKKNIKPVNSINIAPSHFNALNAKNTPLQRPCNVNSNAIGGITERMERLKLTSAPVASENARRMVPPVSSACTQAELTTPTAIQINQAVNQLSSRPTFPNNFDLENIKLPPGITITKVDPSSVNRKPIQMKQQTATSPQTHVRQSMMMSGAPSNVIVVDTGDKNCTPEENNGAKKKRRRRKKDRNDGSNAMFGATNCVPPRMSTINAGIYRNPFANNDYRSPSHQPAAIIQMNGSMVTIRNPALHQALTNQQMEYQNSVKHTDAIDENLFSSVPEEVESGDVDEYERELEAFKRFCSQSVPAESKAKVNLNLEDIVLKKKGSVIGCN